MASEEDNQRAVLDGGEKVIRSYAIDEAEGGLMRLQGLSRLELLF